MEWPGITLSRTLNQDLVPSRHTIADAAKRYDWARLLELLSRHGGMINVSRIDGKAWYAPLHQAAHGGAPVDVVERLIRLGAWRTLRNAAGERPVDVAARRGHPHLLGILEPVHEHRVPQETVLAIQSHFHAVIRGRADELVREHELRLPELEPLLELDEPEMWFPVPGMYGGFKYRLDLRGGETKLISESWCRVVGGSGQRHEITAAGSQLVDEGFV